MSVQLPTLPLTFTPYLHQQPRGWRWISCNDWQMVLSTPPSQTRFAHGPSLFPQHLGLLGLGKIEVFSPKISPNFWHWYKKDWRNTIKVAPSKNCLHKIRCSRLQKANRFRQPVPSSNSLETLLIPCSLSSVAGIAQNQPFGLPTHSHRPKTGEEMFSVWSVWVKMIYN